MPAVSTLAQMRQHLLEKVDEAQEAATRPSTQDIRASLLAAMIEAEEDERKKRRAKGEIIPEDIAAALGTGAGAGAGAAGPSALPTDLRLVALTMLAFLADTAETHPELCVKPLNMLVDMIGRFKPQELQGDADGTVVAQMFGLLEKFAKVDVEAPTAAVSATATAGAGAGGTLADLMREAKSTSLAGIMALALARGTLDDVLNAVRLMLAQVSASAAAAAAASGGATSTVIPVPVPPNLQSLTKAARGVTTSSLVVPSSDTFAAGWTIDAPILASKLGAAVPVTPTALASDGSHLFAYVPATGTLLKLGSGYNDTRPGVIAAATSIFDVARGGSAGRAAAPTADAASLRVHLSMLAGNTHLLVVITPDPATGTGSALRQVSTSDLSVSGPVNTPFHGGALLEESVLVTATAAGNTAGTGRAGAGAGGGVGVGAGVGSLPDTIGPDTDVAAGLPDTIGPDTLVSAPAGAGGAAATPSSGAVAASSLPFVMFAGADGTLFTLARSQDNPDDLAFGRAPAERYMAPKKAAASVAAATANDDKPADGGGKGGDAATTAPVDRGAMSSDNPLAGIAVEGDSDDDDGGAARRATGAAVAAAAAAKARDKAGKDGKDGKDAKKAAKRQVTPDGTVYEADRPAGTTKCVLRKYAYVASTAPAGAMAPVGRLRMDGSVTVFVPPTTADCMLGISGRPDWDVPEVDAHTAAGAAAVAAAVAAGAPPPVPAPFVFPSWVTGIPPRGGKAVLVASVTGNNDTRVAVTTDGDVYYVGDGGVLGMGPATKWSPYDGLGETKVKQVAMAPRCKHALFVTVEGELYAVGAADDGQLGIDIKSDKQKVSGVKRTRARVMR